MVGVSLAHAQGYPYKIIRLVVPYAPGGSTDVVARVIAPALSRNIGQTIVIENKPGACGMTGTHEVLRIAPDGYTLTIATLSTVAANQAINSQAPYSTTDFTAIVNIAETATVIAVNPKFPAKTFAEMVGELKRNPTKYAYGSSGTGGISHLEMEHFKSLAGVHAIHIPYRGAGPALADTVGGQIQIVMDAIPSILPFYQSGQLRPIVGASPVRLKELPETPTFSEVGMPEMTRRIFGGLIGPKGMPTDIVDKINSAVRATVAEPAVRERLAGSGLEPVGGTPQAVAAQINESYLSLKEVVQDQKLTLGL
jgi:tripartite-type tricarboxylate transporter receptor subunit TctC